jgi:hypothetical protein
MKKTGSSAGKNKAEVIGLIAGAVVGIIILVLRHFLNCSTVIIDSVPIAAGLYLMNFWQYPVFLDTVILFLYFMLLGFIFVKLLKTKRKVLFIVIFFVLFLVISALGTSYIGYVLDRLNNPPVE